MNHKCCIIWASITLLLGCDKIDKKLLVVNDSDIDLFYDVLINDTTLRESYILHSLPKNDSTRYGLMGGEGVWEYTINKSNDSTLYIYIFRTESNRLNKKVIENKDYKCKGFNVKQLNELNWRIVYPEHF